MKARRYLCADLVILHCAAGDVTVNLEEIGKTGAVIECEHEPTTGEPVQIRAAGVNLSGTVLSWEAHEFGWRVEIEFSPLTPWRIEAFRPQHLLDMPNQ